MQSLVCLSLVISNIIILIILMIELLREIMPDELVWNVLKYMRHPAAEIINKHFTVINDLKECHENSILFNAKIIFNTFPNIKHLRFITIYQR